MNAGRLVYVAGPSGAGKDSVLAWARAHLAPADRVHFARRTVTRPAQPGGEAHDTVDAETFGRRLVAGDYVMHWRANGLAYGIGGEILVRLQAGDTVVVNGSREYLPQALILFPALELVHVCATPAVLRARLAARGRENAEQIERRLARAASFSPPPGVPTLEIRNDGALEEAGRTLCAHLRGRRA